MNTIHRTPRPTAVGAGLALVALAGLGAVPVATASADSAHVEQVVVADGTGEQYAISSDVSGAGQVTSADGRYVVFSTAAPLVAGDTNDLEDVYRRDTVSGRTELVSQRDGRPGNDYSLEPTISANGNKIAYTTWATNLLGQRDRNGHALDVVVTRMATDRTTLVSHSTAGYQREQNSFSPVISGNGKVVVFQSFASFDRRDDDRREDVYAHHLKRHRIVQVSLHPDNRDVRGNVLVGDVSDNGELVTFGDNNHLWVRNLPERTTVRFWQEPDSPPCQHLPGGGSAGRPMLSGDGRYAAFSSCATDLPGEDGAAADIYRIDLVTGEIDRTHAPGDGNSYLPSLSRDGAFVGFGSEAGDLVAGDDEGQPDAFVVEVATGEVVRVSAGPDGVGGDSWSATTGAVISDAGDAMAFSSYAGNLVGGDVFDHREVFLWRR